MILDDQGLPILDQLSDEGFVDCIFKVHDLKRDQGFYYFNLFASHQGKKVGFAVKLVSDVAPGFDADMNLIRDHVYRQGISFRSLGRVSDDLVTSLGELYEHDVGALRMVPEESFTMIALQNEDTDLAASAVRMKLFGRDAEPFSEDDYYESFFTVDFPNGTVSWDEKDPDYREPLIRALGVR
jgi:hypothetical protein